MLTKKYELKMKILNGTHMDGKNVTLYGHNVTHFQIFFDFPKALNPNSCQIIIKNVFSTKSAKKGCILAENQQMLK